MSIFSDRLVESRQKLNCSQAKLAALLGISPARLGNWERGLREPDINMINKLAETLEVSSDYLIGAAHEPRESNSIDFEKLNLLKITTYKVPLIGNIACGEPLLAEENVESYIDLEDGIRADFALKARGDSMIEARILDGDIVFIRKQEMVENGEIAAVLIDDEATLKRIYVTESSITLVAANPLFPPLVYTPEDYHEIRILGKAIAFQSRVK